MHRRTRAALVAAGIALFATPAAAQAAAVVVPPCSRAVPGEKTIPIQGNGFTPNSFVRLTTAHGETVGGAATDAAGNFADIFDAPPFPNLDTNQLALQLTATDSQGVAAPPVPFNVVRITATMPDRARPTSRVRYRVFGFQTGLPVYLHIRRGGKTRGSFKIGTPTGDCGLASRRMRYMPLKRWTSGTYDYYFQHTKRFDRSQPGVKLSIQIIRRIVPR